MKQGIRVAVVTALFALAACQAPTGDRGSKQASAPMQLKMYDVPADHGGQLAEALGNALGKDASVTMPTPGKLLVYAPREAQASIGSVLGDLHKLAPAAPAQLHLSIWLVDGRAGADADDLALKPLAAALAGVRHAMGPLHFKLVEAAATATATDRGGMIATSATGYRSHFGFQMGALTGHSVHLSLDYQEDGRGGLQRVSTQVDASLGDYLVLAQAPGVCSVPVGLTSPVSADTCPNPPTLRLLIVRVDRLNPPA